jgi:hypothetical protein
VGQHHSACDVGLAVASVTRSKYCCPTCGHPVLPKDPLAILALTERAIFDVIYAAGQAGITRKAVEERVYAGRRDGAASHSIVSVHIRNINQKIKWLHLEIVSHRSNESTYRVRNSSQRMELTKKGYELCASS